MTQWEYKIEKIQGYFFAEEIERRLNSYGEDGWELIAVKWETSVIIIFKKEKVLNPSSRRGR